MMLVGKNLLLYFVKYPEPGKVKTRLAKTLGDQQAARIYQDLAENNFKIFSSLNSKGMKTVIVFDPADKEQEIKKWFSQDKSLYEISRGLNYLAQQGNDLGERLTSAFEFAFQKGFKRVVAIGSDILGLTAEIIVQGFSTLEHHEVVLGPALDGGYYLIGLRQRQPALFKNIPWSSATVLETTLAAVKEQGLSHSLLCELEDLDEIKRGNE